MGVVGEVDIRTEASSVSYMDMCSDIDSHEAAPLQHWPEIFGEEAVALAELASRMGFNELGNGNVNSLNRPDVKVDDMAINSETVWKIRGSGSPSASNLYRRRDVIDAMGIDRQLVFPGFGFVGTILKYNPEAHQFFNYDPAVFDRVGIATRAIQLHNEWCLGITKDLGDRIRPVAFLATDLLDQMMKEAEELLAGGVRAVMISNGTLPADMSPADIRLDPFWKLFADANVPVTFHIGTEFPLLRSQGWDRDIPAFEGALTLEVSIQPYWGSTVHYATENYLTTMILGGVLERHPNLRLGSIENGAQWVGGFAERMDLWADVFAKRMKSIISMKPSEYLNRQVRVTPFWWEDVALYFNRHPNLQDVYAFSSDFPHVEGGYDAKQRFSDKLAGFDETIRRKFFRDNGLFLLPD